MKNVHHGKGALIGRGRTINSVEHRRAITTDIIFLDGLHRADFDSLVSSYAREGCNWKYQEPAFRTICTKLRSRRKTSILME